MQDLQYQAAPLDPQTNRIGVRFFFTLDGPPKTYKLAIDEQPPVADADGNYQPMDQLFWHDHKNYEVSLSLEPGKTYAAWVYIDSAGNESTKDRSAQSNTVTLVL